MTPFTVGQIVDPLRKEQTPMKEFKEPAIGWKQIASTICNPHLPEATHFFDDNRCPPGY
jgi:hypothetical protein